MLCIRKLLLTAIFLLFFTALFSQDKPTFNPGQDPIPQGKKWVKMENMSDEFDGSSLNTAKWDDQDPQWQGRAPARFEKSAVSVGGGDLKIVASKKSTPDGQWTHNGGLVRSINKATYGYYETRMKANRTVLSSTFWLFNKRNESPTSSCDYRTTELDVTENVGVDGYPEQNRNWVDQNIRTINSNTHSRDAPNANQCGTNTGINGNKTAIGEEAWRGYHVYGVWWKNANELIFFLDGKEAHRITPPEDFDLGMYLRMVVESYDWNKPRDGFDNMGLPQDQRTTYYDWTRSWQLEDCNSDCGEPPVTGTNLVQNPGLETGNKSPWTGAGTIVSNNAANGTYAVRQEGGQSGHAQIINVQPNTTYTLSANIKVQSGNIFLGVKDYGGTEKSNNLTNSNYQSSSLQFTTGATNTTAQIYFWSGTSGTVAFGDDFSVIGPGGTIDVTAIDVIPNNPATLTAAGATVDLGATVTPSNATDLSVTWGSSNTSVATVDQTGIVTALANGTTIITATSVSNPSVSGSETVTINIPPTTIDVTSIDVTPNNPATLTAEGATIGLGATVTPNNATDPSVTWSSSNASVATVDQATGIVTAIANGTTTITATSVSNPSVSGSEAINVDIPSGGCDIPYSDNGVTIENQTVNWSTGNIDISCASSVDVSLTASGVGSMENADFLNIYYKVDGGPQQVILENVNTYSQQTLTVNNVSGNTLEILVNAFTSFSNEVYTVSNITVSEINTIDVTAIDVTPNNPATLTTAGATVDLGATVTPNNATDPSVTWSSSDTSVATVDQGTGIVTAIANGTATITATSVSTPTVSGSETVTVDISSSSSNLVGNPGFETGDLTSWNNGWGNQQVVNNNANNGSHAVQVTGAGGAQQSISLQPNTAYTLTARIKAQSGTVRLGVKSYGGADVSNGISSTSYVTSSLNFTTGSTNNTAIIYLYAPNGNNVGFGDDFSVTASAVNAKARINDITFDNGLNNTPQVMVYPNPIGYDGNFNIALGDSNEEKQVIIYDLSGRIVFQKSTSSSNINMNKSELKEASGLYFIMVNQSGEQDKMMRLIVE